MQQDFSTGSSSQQQAHDLNLILKYWPTLATYLSRVGATLKNFRSHVIQETDADGRYKFDVARITVEKDGTVAVKPGPERSIDLEQFAPTEEEQAQIKVEVTKTAFPFSIAASDLPPQLIGVDPDEYYPYRDLKGELTLWIQWRKLDQEGESYYVPYSKWSDGVWRVMEPDGLLPLFGLDRLKGKDRRGRWLIMLHEGAKGARHVQRLVDNKVSHPWLAELDRYTHLGWPGGVNRAERVDWSQIKQLDPDRLVTFVCDRDLGGENAISRISRLLRRELRMLMFDERFPETFDLADEWPNNPKWWRGNHYCGPTLDECLYSATWATEVIKSVKSDRPAHGITKPFAKEWLWAAEPNAFIGRHQLDRLQDRTVFNSRVRSFSDVEDTARLLLRMRSPVCDGVTYDPGEPGGVINVGGRRLVNTHRPSEAKPIKGSPRPFIKFMLHLLPKRKDRREVYRWCVTLVSRPDVRMRYALRAPGRGQDHAGPGHPRAAGRAAQRVVPDRAHDRRLDVYQLDRPQATGHRPRDIQRSQSQDLRQAEGQDHRRTHRCEREVPEALHDRQLDPRHRLLELSPGRPPGRRRPQVAGARRDREAVSS